ncbi:MAG: hypothetical protein A3G52_00295 [Candidatus Taylorbacteria bacterium RIFCSPLOWO2_12_FULL_43_20]|uniref:Peptidyl-tRNA hydrolase n=1 Tax=Candidatus Taylorbacteria bacterium RIFCSPLOWO2_12_FULL_43_20 TaxID=1802332 RepID=A0A1G2P3P7_9BACT|nr:MAG: hypothetical protein A2825_01690 [Candidatus Taylorbacteria bacterium RIFCSPHIGHO2_01_FULL_43_120]OHA23095.1 MAG: hypothetical protein A3B98_03515 [Candidatus Taylorbacteria bacterium RIFCSPHIGHO2_02_FULL_43_55]OHA28924.1 MAG: hypothetical protein A3E92_04615 [Candidatus Taylorbacteria bacterium RIFCSPHIGHO2_12_FULL_42_34]OHA30908.1 MAG: hypothetical protein A3B09_04565 [Candidatus Taylorbacteria bacterium RIFCSPLOWO2_01_FULL_43_83]OHA39298.1 MAG: hypothetical protein A3H58_03895 [Candi
MKYIIVGLGNPGPEYEKTRHNAGRIVAEIFRKKNNFAAFAYDKRMNALISKGSLAKGKDVLVVMPETFMNKSGNSMKGVISSAGELERTVIIHDDLDLSLDKIKVSYNKSSGGHKGVESVMRALGTEKFMRIRVGISPADKKGRAKKPHGEDKINNYILKQLKADDLKLLEKQAKKSAEAVAAIIMEGKEKAMTDFN